MTSVAMLSLHTSPLAQPGEGDSGGMNVYVRELAGALAQAGVPTSVYVRAWTKGLPQRVTVEPLFEVIHVPCGAFDLEKEDLPGIVGEFAEWVGDDIARNDTAEVLHANYWLSAVAGHTLKHQLGLPLVSTFHTLGRVKALGGDHEPVERVEAERGVIACSDLLCASTAVESDQLVRLYGADPARIEIIPPGVDRAFFSPGSQAGARRALGRSLGAGPVLLFVGRIQPLKGLDLAVKALAQLADPTAQLVVVGGASGVEGASELERVQKLVAHLGVTDRVHWVDPQPHELLSTFYRAADVCLVPSRSESFGLVALEAAACGTPVVASAVGGLLSLVENRRSGRLIGSREPADWAVAIDEILGNPGLHAAMSQRSLGLAGGFGWSATAGRLRRAYADLAASRQLTACGAL